MKSYGTFELTGASPAQSFIEPLDARQVRTWLGISETDADEDQQFLLDGLISAARNVAELHQHRDLAVKQWDLHLDEFPTEEIELLHPLQSVDLVQYTDSVGSVTTMVEGTDYTVDLSRNVLTPISGGSWPSGTLQPSGAVLVRFTSGYPPAHPFWSGDQGQTIKQGMRLLICDWHERRIPGDIPDAAVWLFNMGARLNVP